MTDLSLIERRLLAVTDALNAQIIATQQVGDEVRKLRNGVEGRGGYSWAASPAISDEIRALHLSHSPAASPAA